MVEPGETRARETAVVYSKPGQPAALRRAAVAALGRFADDDPILQDELIALAGDPARNVRAEAWHHLARLRASRALPVLEARYAREDPFIRQRLSEAIATLKSTDQAEGESAKEAAGLEHQVRELELRAREFRHQAEGLRLKAERARLETENEPH